MKDVVLNEIKKEKSNFEYLLIKICFDFNIKNYKGEVDSFLEKLKKRCENLATF